MYGVISVKGRHPWHSDKTAKLTKTLFGLQDGSDALDDLYFFHQSREQQPAGDLARGRAVVRPKFKRVISAIFPFHPKRASPVSPTVRATHLFQSSYFVGSIKCKVKGRRNVSGKRNPHCVLAPFLFALTRLVLANTCCDYAIWNERGVLLYWISSWEWKAQGCRLSAKEIQYSSRPWVWYCCYRTVLQTLRKPIDSDKKNRLWFFCFL